MVIFRELRESDWDSWSSLWKKYLLFYETDLPPEVYRSSFSRMLSDLENEFRGIVAVDEENGALIGLAHFLFHRDGWRVESSCYLQDLFVAEEQRGRGVGRALMAAVADRASAQGCGSMYWKTQESNGTARILYDKVGTKTPFVEYEKKLM